MARPSLSINVIGGPAGARCITHLHAANPAKMRSDWMASGAELQVGLGGAGCKTLPAAPIDGHDRRPWSGPALGPVRQSRPSGWLCLGPEGLLLRPAGDFRPTGERSAGPAWTQALLGPPVRGSAVTGAAVAG